MASGVTGLRRPLVGLALLMVLGTAAGLRHPSAAAAALVWGFIFLVAGVCVLRRAAGLALLLAAWTAAALAGAGLASGGVSVRDVRFLPVASSQPVGLCGVIDAEPERTARGSWVFPLRVEGVRSAEHWQRARGRVRVFAAAAPQHAYRYGDRWIWTGRLDLRNDPPRFYQRPGTERFLESGRGNALRAWCLRRREASARILARGLDDYPSEAGLLRALLLGYRADLQPDWHDLFSVTGTLHIFAISGLHVGMVALLAMLLLNALGFPRHLWILVLGPFLVLYTLATGAKPSAVRACLMALVYWTAPLLRRRPDGPSTLAAAALLILMAAPMQLTEMGFLLSFGVVSGLLAFYLPLARWLSVSMKPDPMRLQDEAPPVRWGRRCLYYVGGLACASTAAWITAAPLSARFFNIFSPIALAGNLLVVPSAFAIVFTGALSLLGGVVHPLPAEVCNHANRWLVRALVEFIGLLRSVPGGHRFVRSPAWGWVALWYGTAAALLLGRGRVRRTAAVIALAAIAGGCLLTARNPRLEILVPAFSRGAAAVVDLPGPSVLLVDAGSAFESRQWRRLLRQRGVNRVDALILTHADAAHVGGAGEILRILPVREVWCVPDRGRSRIYNELLEQVREMRIPVRVLHAGASGMLPGGVAWDILHPPPGEPPSRADDGSMVLRLARGDASVLFMGGAGSRVEQNVLASRRDPSATILMAGRPDRDTVCGDDWIAAVKPDLVVLGGAGFGGSSSPRVEAAQRLDRAGTTTWRLDRDGGLLLRLYPASKAARKGRPVSWHAYPERGHAP